MKFSVFGIGYVGGVCTGCLAKAGHMVVAVDSNLGKVELIRQGKAPIIEPGLDALLAGGVADGRVSATTDAAAAVAATDVSFVCVGTPSLPNGKVDFAAVTTVAQQLGSALRAKGSPHTIVVRSTMVPGSMEETVIPMLEFASGMRAGLDFGIGYYPEFLRETTALADFDDPGTIVIGEHDRETADLIAELNAGNGGRVFRVSLREAEAIKYANNSWHAVKVSFANEIGLISKAAGLDGRKIMDILCSDTRLNISRTYLRPGFAFGGSCLPKDLRGLQYFAHSRELTTPLLDGVSAANENQIATAYRLIEATGKRRVALIGLTFKPATDDLRESPFVELAERLVGKGYQLGIYDPNVTYSHLVGANRQYILSRIPHLFALLDDDLGALISGAEVVIIGKTLKGTTSPPLAQLLTPDQTVIDLAGDETVRFHPRYQGICW
jgi:GDP-mannose 6-dehydrogenase